MQPACPAPPSAPSHQPPKEPKLDVVVYENHSEIKPQDDWRHSEWAIQIDKGGVTYVEDNEQGKEVFMASGRKIETPNPLGYPPTGTNSEDDTSIWGYHGPRAHVIFWAFWLYAPNP
eukprot:5779190-Karenia_brevis.AAC.1